LWAVFVPLDEGIPAPGVITVESMRKVVSHFTGGTVATVHVQENQYVKVDDPLITLGDTKASAVYNTAVHEYIAASAKLARLNAEEVSDEQLHFSDELLLYVGKTGRRDYLASQEQLFRARKLALRSEQAVLKENLAASHAQLVGAREQLAARSHQV
jgi:protease secretion system membrane fusion protein